VVASHKIFRSARQSDFWAVEFIHGRGAHEPRADAKAGSRIFEEITFMLVAGNFPPSIANYFAIDARAHVTDNVRLHYFPRLNARVN
jgi:hypothetical protein